MISEDTTGIGNKGWRRSWLPIVGIVGVLSLLLMAGIATISIPRTAAHAATGDWSTYLGDIGRSGYNGAETTINTTTARTLKVHWTNLAAGAILSQPIVANGKIYWGSGDGLEHATDPTTGKDAWTANLGQTVNCAQTTPSGVISSPTVTIVKIGGILTNVLFVGGGNSQVYALNADTGAVIWHTPVGATLVNFLYGSPAFYKGSVYIGVSDYHDCPEAQGQMVQLNAVTGAIQHTFNVVPAGCLGGGVWSSPAIDTGTGMLYFTTGNGSKCTTTEQYTSSVIELNSTDLSFVGSWQIPSVAPPDNGDVGSTVTFFKANIAGVLHHMLGFVAENGNYYALDRANLTAGPLWNVQLAQPGDTPATRNVASSVWDGTKLYAAGAVTTINGVSCGGSVEALNPATGAFLWQRCLPNNVAAPLTGVPGVLVVDSGAIMHVVDASTGIDLFVYHEPGSFKFLGPAAISNGILYQGNMDGNLIAFGL